MRPNKAISSHVPEVRQFCWNLRWLAWRKDHDPDNWGAKVVEMTRRFIDGSRASALLRGAEPTRNEVEAIAEVSGHEAEALEAVPLYGTGDELRTQNLRYLVEALPRGQKQVAADHIGITNSQLSRWGNDVRRPHPGHERKLLAFHGLDSDTDLGRVPLFLSIDPISGYAKKKWAAERLMEMSASDVARLYPALKRLLRDDETD